MYVCVHIQYLQKKPHLYIHMWAIKFMDKVKFLLGIWIKLNCKSPQLAESLIYYSYKNAICFVNVVLNGWKKNIFFHFAAAILITKTLVVRFSVHAHIIFWIVTWNWIFHLLHTHIYVCMYISEITKLEIIYIYWFYISRLFPQIAKSVYRFFSSTSHTHFKTCLYNRFS